MGNVAPSESLPIETDSLRLDSWVLNSGDKIGFCAVKESQNLSACQTFQTQNREKSSSFIALFSHIPYGRIDLKWI